MRTCPSCGGVVGRDCFNPVECAYISDRIQEDRIQRLEKLVHAVAPEKHFTDLPKEKQEEINQYDLREMKHYYGGWDKLREVIKNLEDNDNEAAYERRHNGYY